MNVCARPPRWPSLLLVAALGGCPSTPVTDAGTDAPSAPDVPSDPDAPAASDAPLLTDAAPPTDTGRAATLTFVIVAGDIPEVSATNEVPGIDLDGRPGLAATERCDDAFDWISPITGSSNVDNQYAANLAPLVGSAVGTTAGASLAEAYALGVGLVGIVVEGVDSTDFDLEVLVRLHSVALPLGATLALDGSGRVAPDQTFSILADLGTRPGAITGGRLVGGGSSMTLPLFGGEQTIDEPRFSATLSEAGLERGELGGSIAIASLVAEFGRLGTPVDEATIRSVAQPDLDPDPAGANCAGISLGMSFEAVPAVLEPR